MMVVCVTSPARLSHVVPFRSAWPLKPPPAPLPRLPPSPCPRMPAPRRPCAPPWPTPSPTTPPRSSPYRTIFMPIPRSDTASIMRWPRWLTSCGPMAFSPESGSTTWIRLCAPRSGRAPRSLPVLLVLPVPLAPLAPPVLLRAPPPPPSPFLPSTTPCPASAMPADTTSCAPTPWEPSSHWPLWRSMRTSRCPVGSFFRPLLPRSPTPPRRSSPGAACSTALMLPFRPIPTPTTWPIRPGWGCVVSVPCSQAWPRMPRRSPSWGATPLMPPPSPWPGSA